MDRLSHITLKGFKSIREMDLELGALNVLIGANGAGKSNLLSFFSLLRALAERRLPLFVAQEGGAGTILHHGHKRTAEIDVKVSFFDAGKDITYSGKLLASPPDALFVDGFVLGPEEIKMMRGVGTGVTHEFHGERPLAGSLLYRSKHIDEEGQLGRTLGGLARYHFQDTSKEAPIRHASQIDDNRALEENGNNLAAFLHMLKRVHAPHYESIRDTIRLAAPFFDDFVLEPSALNTKVIQLEWRERGSDMPFFAHHLSDGTLRFIALATALLQPDPPAIITLDEPELGLHPYAITLLASLIRSASKTRQLIVATQSVTLLDALAAPEDVIVVDRKKLERGGSESSFRRLVPEELATWLEEYTLGELWEKNVLGGRP